MGKNNETDEVYEQFMKKAKKKKIVSTICVILVLVFVLAMAALLWIVNNLETFDKLIGKAKKDKKPVEYIDIE